MVLGTYLLFVSWDPLRTGAKTLDIDQRQDLAHSRASEYKSYASKGFGGQDLIFGVLWMLRERSQKLSVKSTVMILNMRLLCS